MPFTTSSNRKKMSDYSIQYLESNDYVANIEPGDRCYVEYKRMVNSFGENPRWTNIDSFLKSVFPNNQQRAKVLAFLVFMHFYGYKYEELKREENGDIFPGLA